MQIIFDSIDEKLHHVLGGRRGLRRLPLHDGQQLSDDFTLLKRK